MKNKYKKDVEVSVKKTALLGSTIIILIVATVIGSSLIKTEYNNFKLHIKNFKNTLIEREKFYIKTSVENIKNDIEFEKISILNNKKQRIKNQSIIAYNLINSLYSQTKMSSKEEIIDLIKSAITNIAKEENDIHYFIFDTQGNLLLNTENPTEEGVNFLDFEDINGVKFINEMIDNKKQEQKYVEYFWYKPSKKITFSRQFKPLGIIIGSSSFLESRNEELKDKLLKKIMLQKFNQEEFLFIYHINSLNNILEQSTLLIDRNIYSEDEDLEAIEKLMIDTGYKGDEYISYSNNQKIIYGTYLTKLRFFIGIGINLSHIYDIVQKEKEISLKNMNENISKLIVIIVIMAFIFFIISVAFTKRIEKLLKVYKENVILNEEKYQLLFNYSNDAFLISEIKNHNSSIISCNQTALELTAYEDNELIEHDFFSLFEGLGLEELKKNKSLFKTVKLKTKDEKIKNVEVNVIIYDYENKELLFASLRDVTERTKLIEEKAKQDNMLIQKSKMAAMGEMIGNIAHQWRQPLSQVSGLFFDIESAYDYKELDKKYLSQRVEEANDLLEYMSKTIDDFRNFFNPNSKIEDFFVTVALSNAINIISSTLKFHNIELEIDCSETFHVNGYKNEYSQAIVNIISNAKDILVERKIQKPKIKIYNKEVDGKETLFIEDNAGGIEEDIISRIFEPYFTTKRDYGTGIGLYMTKLIIEEKMKGSISVENSEKGALFAIRI
ncbi:cache domain-containing protein [Arcobacter arenosus]|uniref:histidine kinase n=1 Tax=Arcobacter arenosus TaxID=2576037 RepID=A0A5R8Y1U7_9BACT|nr:cache domain-containing protein [Arcobacter arenosus]TLP39146.1 PAS domain S-box protein [Arcobacter arenosus]